MTLGEDVGEAQQQNERNLTSQDIGRLRSQILIMTPRKVKPKERHLIVKKKQITGKTLVYNHPLSGLYNFGEYAGTGMIWGSVSLGTWGTNKWGDPFRGFFLGHPGAAILGTSELGETGTAFVTIRVVNPQRKYIDNLYGTTFKDTGRTTATWDTSDGQLEFASSQTAISKPIYLNEETITSAKITLTTEGAGSVTPSLSADGGTTWEEVTDGVSHTFTTTGTDLRWRLVGTNINVTSVEVEYQFKKLSEHN